MWDGALLSSFRPAWQRLRARCLRNAACSPSTPAPAATTAPAQVCEKNTQNCLSAANAPDCAAGSQTCPLTGLIPGKEYTVLAVATKVDNGVTVTSQQSNPADFITPTKPVVTLDAAVSPNPTTTTVAVKVTPPPQASLQPWVSYELKACLAANPSTCEPVQTCIAVAAGAADSPCVYTGLDPATTYTMTATAKKSIASLQQTSQESDPSASFTTAPAPTQLSIVSAQALSPTGGVATATLPDLASQTTYDLGVRLLPGLGARPAGAGCRWQAGWLLQKRRAAQET